MIKFHQLCLYGSKPHLFLFQGKWAVISPTGDGFNTRGYPQGQSFDSFRETVEKAKECWTCKPPKIVLSCAAEGQRCL